ncbi:transcriptional regulator [Thermoplasmatales archaeon SW_10_69_26]|nr:MAG: transcriptional regulator [Thermoplasmatales archaeon SW_10_69_26]
MVPADDIETRLERLSNETDTCSLAEFQDKAEDLRSDPGFERAVLQAGALANEKRLITLALLAERDSLCACEIQAALDCTNPTVSHHMDCLLTADLVTSEKRGKWKHYELTDDGRRLVAEVLP